MSNVRSFGRHKVKCEFVHSKPVHFPWLFAETIINLHSWLFQSTKMLGQPFVSWSNLYFWLGELPILIALVGYTISTQQFKLINNPIWSHLRPYHHCLVVWNMFSIQLGISSSQLTFISFSIHCYVEQVISINPIYLINKYIYIYTWPYLINSSSYL